MWGKARLKIALGTCILEDKLHHGTRLRPTCKRRCQLRCPHQVSRGKRCGRPADSTQQQANHDISVCLCPELCLTRNRQAISYQPLLLNNLAKT